MNWQELLDYCESIPPNYREGVVRCVVDGAWQKVDICEAIDDDILGEGSPYLYLTGE